MKLIKINTDHYVVVDETIQPVNDYYYDSFINKVKSTNNAEYGEASHCWQITHSTRAMYKDEYISLQEVKELIGEVDVEKKAFEYTSASQAHRRGFIDGYNQALEDNKEKKYTEEDMWKAFEYGKTLDGYDWFGDLLESLQPKTEWEVCFVDGKLKLK